MKKYSVSPPIELAHLAPAIEQCEAQGWMYVDAVCVGMAQKPQRLALANTPPIVTPMVSFIVYKIVETQGLASLPDITGPKIELPGAA